MGTYLYHIALGRVLEEDEVEIAFVVKAGRLDALDLLLQERFEHRVVGGRKCLACEALASN